MAGESIKMRAHRFDQSTSGLGFWLPNRPALKRSAKRFARNEIVGHGKVKFEMGWELYFL